MDIAQRVLQLCKHYNITSNRLATMADIPSSTMQNIVAGNTATTTVANIEKVCRALDITLAEFFTDEAIVDMPPEARQEQKIIEQYINYKYNLGK